MESKQVRFSAGKLAKSVHLSTRQIARYAAGEYGEENRPPGAQKEDGYHWSFRAPSEAFEDWILKMNSHQKGNHRWRPETRRTRKTLKAKKASGHNSGKLGFLEGLGFGIDQIFRTWYKRTGSHSQDWSLEQCERWFASMEPLREFETQVRTRIEELKTAPPGPSKTA